MTRSYGWQKLYGLPLEVPELVEPQSVEMKMERIAELMNEEVSVERGGVESRHAPDDVDGRWRQPFAKRKQPGQNSPVSRSSARPSLLPSLSNALNHAVVFGMFLLGVTA